MDKIVTCFFFNGNAEEAVGFYVSLLPDSRFLQTTRYPAGAPAPEGSVMTIEFELQGRPFMAINGGPDFTFSPAISLVAYCDTQQELDRLWDALLEGGAPMACGWLTDRFGVAWQIVPTALPGLMAGDAQCVERVMHALWGMVKLDLVALERAAEGAA